MSEERLSGEKAESKKPWVEPSVVSVSIPVVEGALAESYRVRANDWADKAKARRLLIDGAD